MQEQNDVIISDDGSHTVIHPKYQVSYHSRRGAIQESTTVFIASCLEARFRANNLQKKEIHVFEMGFGTGLNAFLAMQWALHHQCKISYTGIDSYPLPHEIYHQLNYSTILGYETEWRKLATSEWNVRHSLGKYFSFEKRHSEIELCTFEEEFDCIFYDAFAPASQPELWDLSAASRLYQFLSPGGICTTYCAQGQFRRNLQEVGFIVERIPGPPGKREMLRATRPEKSDQS